MICCFPAAYPDELLYSQLSRYYAKSGYLAYTYVAEELFVSKTVRPDMEFVNTYTPAAVEMITKYIPMETVIQKHTMFPYYAHFLSKERRQKAFQSLVSMEGGHHNLLPIPKRKNNTDRYLRYCPLCAEHDRNAYGETYWHRVHQMVGINVCPAHDCYLADSIIMMTSKASPMLKTAEESIPLSEEIKSSDNGVEYRVARYMAEVFQMDVDLDSDISVGRFLHSRMAGGKYCSVRGEQRNISMFHADFMEHYRLLSDNWFTEQWQIQKVLNDRRTNFYEVCLIALFLNISAEDLVCRDLPEKTHQQEFDEEIHRLHEQGMNYAEIARLLNASYDVVKSIGERRYGIYHQQSENPLKGGVKSRNWSMIDKETLPLVRAAIRQIQNDTTARPIRITVGTVEKQLNFYKGKIRHYLPKCKAEIMQHMESQEQYWAREVVWAANQIRDTGSSLCWMRITRLTNLRRKDFEACLPYVADYADRILAEEIQRL